MSNRHVQAEIKMNGEIAAKVGHPEGLTDEKKAKIMFHVLMGRHSLKSIKSDDEYLPVFKVPISILAVATLNLLDIEKYNGTDEDVQLWREYLRDFI